MQDVQLTTAALGEHSLDLVIHPRFFENLRQSFKPNTGEDCLIRTTDRDLVTLSCIFALVSFCLTLGKLHTLWGFSYLSNADNTCLILGRFKALDESCFISLLHYQEMPDLEVIMSYGRRVITHAPLFQDRKKKTRYHRSSTAGLPWAQCSFHGICRAVNSQ